MKRILFLSFSFISYITCFGQYEPLDSVPADSTAIDEEAIIEFLNTQLITEICGVEFGTSYETAKQLLEYKFGDSEYDFEHSRQSISFKNKSYAGFIFDDIHFRFQSDGRNTYLNDVIFIIIAKNSDEAKKKRDMLRDRISQKYYLEKGTDDNKFTYYYGGVSPLKDSMGLSIDIIKYSAEIARIYGQYGVRLRYGPYNYVREEF